VERRLAIDQGHKMMASINAIVAKEAGAIAAQWEHHYSSDPRHSHLMRDGKIYLLENSWARTAGLVKPSPDGIYEDHEQAGEWVYCRCTARYIYNLRNIPEDMLTNKGKEALAEAKRKVSAL
jgi:uncharacterized protein with gpF-like domain